MFTARGRRASAAAYAEGKSAEWTAGDGEEVVGVGSKTLRLLTMERMGSTGIHRASGREKTSVQKIGGVMVGSGEARVRLLFS